MWGDVGSIFGLKKAGAEDEEPHAAPIDEFQLMLAMATPTPTPTATPTKSTPRPLPIADKVVEERLRCALPGAAMGVGTERRGSQNAPLRRNSSGNSVVGQHRVTFVEAGAEGKTESDNSASAAAGAAGAVRTRGGGGGGAEAAAAAAAGTAGTGGGGGGEMSREEGHVAAHGVHVVLEHAVSDHVLLLNDSQRRTRAEALPLLHAKAHSQSAVLEETHPHPHPHHPHHQQQQQQQQQQRAQASYRRFHQEHAQSILRNPHHPPPHPIPPSPPIRACVSPSPSLEYSLLPPPLHAAPHADDGGALLGSRGGSAQSAQSTAASTAASSGGARRGGPSRDVLLQGEGGGRSRFPRTGSRRVE